MTHQDGKIDPYLKEILINQREETRRKIKEKKKDLVIWSGKGEPKFRLALEYNQACNDILSSLEQ